MTDYKVPTYVPAHLRGRYINTVAEARRDRAATSEWVGESWMRNFRAAPRQSNEYAMKLATIRRGIANFVYVMTKKNIPVTFSTGQQSYATKDERIVISATNDPSKLDANVGTAIHEAAHIILSKRTNIKESIPLYDWIPFIKDFADIFIPAHVWIEAERIGRTRDNVKQDFKFLLNVIEDRRIDTWVYANAKGYRAYYDAFYAALWNKPLISRALIHPLGRRPIFECYRLHVTNMTNPLFEVDAMKGLREIMDIINLKDISRLSNDERWAFWNPVRWKMIQFDPTQFDANDLPEMIQVANRVLEIMYTNSLHPSACKVQRFSNNSPADADEEISPIADLDEDAEGETVPTDDEDKQQVVMNPNDAKSKPKNEKRQNDPSNQDSSDDLDDPSEDNKDRSESKHDDELTDEEDENSPAKHDDEDEEEDGDELDGDEDGDLSDDEDEWDEEDDDEAIDRALDDSEHDDLNEGDESEAKSETQKRDEQDAADAETLDKTDNSDDFDNVVKRINNEQARMLDGDMPKESVSTEQERIIEAVEESGAQLHQVGAGMDVKYNCVLFPKMTDSLLMSPTFSFVKRGAKYPTTNEQSVRAVKNGERLGNVLAHKLRVMADESITHFPRQRHGKIDKRAIAGLGFGDEQVFSHSETERHTPVKLHFSVDASGSMEGEKWERALTVAVALAKAAEKIKTLDVVISLRGTGSTEAQLAVVYDSKVDKFGRVRRFFPYFGPYSGTPEGLCFEAILSQITENGKGAKNYFVNISDGAPAFWYHNDGQVQMYSGEAAWKHTALMVKQMEEAGVTVLSYFVGAKAMQFGGDADAFKQMYGKAASFIDTNNVTAIATTLNRLFLS